MVLATIKDVALKAGVTPSTVSRLLNNGYVKKETKERIWTAIKELNYTPSSKALSLRYGLTRTIGCITPHIDTPYSGGIVDGIESTLIEHGFNLLLLQARAPLPDEEMFYTKLLREQKVDGIILVSPRDISINDLQAIQSDALPCILIEGDPDTHLACIVPNNYRGGYLATKHLIEHGHYRIAHITGPEHWRPCQERLRGYRDALDEAGIHFDPKLVIAGNLTIEQSYTLTTELLKSSPLPTALFAINDYTAIGAMKAIHDASMKIPDDISVIGFDNILVSGYLRPALTTIANPVYQMGELAAQRLIQMIETKTIDNTFMELPVKLIERESTGANRCAK